LDKLIQHRCRFIITSKIYINHFKQEVAFYTGVLTYHRDKDGKQVLSTIAIRSLTFLKVSSIPKLTMYELHVCCRFHCLNRQSNTHFMETNSSIFYIHYYLFKRVTGHLTTRKQLPYCCFVANKTHERY
jgi:hypothetical protein